MRRLVLCLSVAGFVSFVGPSSANAQQSVNLFIGGFVPQSLDSRKLDDVLVQNDLFLTTLNRQAGLDVGQFDHVTVGGEWLFGVGDFLEGGFGASFYQRTVPVVDTYNVDGATGNEIESRLKLRLAPVSATVRFLPLGHSGFQPYIGAGVNMYYWRYSETGQFVDYSGAATYGPCPKCGIVPGRSIGSGSAVGPVVLGGVRVPVGLIDVGGEIRWQGGEGRLPGDQGFAGSKIALGGMNYLLTFRIPF